MANVIITGSEHYEVATVEKHLDRIITQSGVVVTNVFPLALGTVFDSVVKQWAEDNNKNYIDLNAKLEVAPHKQTWKFELIASTCQDAIIMWDGHTAEIQSFLLVCNRTPITIHQTFI